MALLAFVGPTEKRARWLTLLFSLTVLESTSSQDAQLRVTADDSVTILNRLDEYVAKRGWEDPAVAVDNYRGLRKLPDFQRLRELMVSDWRKVVDAAIVSSVSPMRRTLVIVSAQALPPDVYRQFLDYLVGRAESGDLTSRELTWAILPPHAPLSRVWMNTWEQAETRSIVQRAKKLYSNDVTMQSYLDRLLSGELEKDNDRFIKASSNPPPTANGFPPSQADEIQSPSTPNAGLGSTPSAMKGPLDRTNAFVWIVLGLVVLAILYFVIKRS